MQKKSVKRRLPLLKSEGAVDKWLENADLTEYFTGNEFQKTRFAKLEKKLVEDAYMRSLASQPVTLRLPMELIQKLKLAAMNKGIAYQTLARLLLQDRVKKLLSR